MTLQVALILSSIAAISGLVGKMPLILTANQVAQITGLTDKSVNQIFSKFRRRIARECERASPFSKAEIGKCYFGGKRIRGKFGRRSTGKTIVFGLLKRNGCVYTEVVKAVKKVKMQLIIRGQVSLDSVIHLDSWRGYNGLDDVGDQKLLRVYHSNHEFAYDDAHINGIESFWSYANRRLLKFNGVATHTFFCT